MYWIIYWVDRKTGDADKVEYLRNKEEKMTLSEIIKDYIGSGYLEENIVKMEKRW